MKLKGLYGKAVLKDLGNKLIKEFGKGFDERNLRKMRQFYLFFSKWDSVSTELSWTHYRHLLKVEDKKARLWYMEEATNENWSIRIYEDKIKGEDDNPTIGLILCSDKTEAIAKYSVLADGEKIFASKYQLVLPKVEVLEAELKKEIEQLTGER